MLIEKTYDPQLTEIKLYERWEKSGAFACDPTSAAKPYCIMMPPPNVTGSLHMGHALSYTLQDILCRLRRMQGFDVLWQPGTDHAGIATQMMVEKQIIKENAGETRRSMGREKFLARVWQWKAESGNRITHQLRRLGASCDWSRERFTMDPALNKGVVRAFVELYRKKLIYKDKRLVNWDPVLLTAVSDLEVELKEQAGHMWHFRYPLVDDPNAYICVATTRPETMLGDGAVAVNPKDERYQHLIGKFVHLPLTGRKLPIIADDYADPEKGSGAVKITAAHDFNDFAVWRRHRDKSYFKDQQDGGLINLFDQHACLNDNVPDPYKGLERYAARKKIVEDLEALGLIDHIENIRHAVPRGDRSDTVIEPWLSEQWYCDAATLAKPALEAVEKGDTRFVPAQWTNTYFSWMRNIEPWCISRQLWWGHQIPGWYGPDRKVFVAESEAEAQAEAKVFYGKEVALTRDEDVLDTWFSAALWPFSTLGWPKTTAELRRYYPTDVLITAFDIIFFWVARMMMMGLHLMKDDTKPEVLSVPFHAVYIHPLVLDEKGQKMSKTKGNVIDPLVMIDKYGCDALRFTLAHMSTPGRDIRLAPQRIEGNRNFATKLWNAARFCQMNECFWENDFKPSAITHTVNKWILGEMRVTAEKVASELEIYRFDLAASTAYDFVWNSFCDWYLEFTKPILAGDNSADIKQTRAATAYVLGQMLKILHPFMPYITEELWGHVVGEGMLMKQAWPLLSDVPTDSSAKVEIDWIIRIISTVRTLRSELNVPPAAQVQLVLKDVSPSQKTELERHQILVMRLARIASISYAIECPKGAVQAVIDGATIILPLADVIDVVKEEARLRKEIDRLNADLLKLDQKLNNKDFLDRAPSDIVEELRERKSSFDATVVKLEAAVRGLQN